MIKRLLASNYETLDIYRTICVCVCVCVFFSNAHDTFTRIDHKLIHKESVNKFQKKKKISKEFILHCICTDTILIAFRTKLYIINIWDVAKSIKNRNTYIYKYR